MSPENLPAVSVPLPWQAEAWSRWQAQLAADQLPHALLVSGPEGIGKQRLAIALARWLLCHEPRNSANCGECPACRHSRAGSHGDWLWVGPSGKGQVIRVDQIREVIAFAWRTAGFGRRKVITLVPADRMNTAAANALLKCLEEPAEDTFLILVTDRLHALPATVRSRCQRLSLTLPEASQALDWLDPLTGQRERSQALLELAGGRPLRAEALFRSDAAEALGARRTLLSDYLLGRSRLPQVAAALGERPLLEALDEIEALLLSQLRTAGRDQLRDGGRDWLLVLDEIAALRRSAVAGANPNPQLALESLLVPLDSSFLGGDVGATMARSSTGGSP